MSMTEIELDSVLKTNARVPGRVDQDRAWAVTDAEPLLSRERERIEEADAARTRVDRDEDRAIRREGQFTRLVARREADALNDLPGGDVDRLNLLVPGAGHIQPAPALIQRKSGRARASVDAGDDLRQALVEDGDQVPDGTRDEAQMIRDR